MHFSHCDGKYPYLHVFSYVLLFRKMTTTLPTSTMAKITLDLKMMMDWTMVEHITSSIRINISMSIENSHTNCTYSYKCKKSTLQRKTKFTLEKHYYNNHW